MTIPTADQLAGPAPRGLDEESVLRYFLGKSRDEALELFRRMPCTEEFSYMAPIGFLFYVDPAFEYLRSESSQGDWEFAHGLLSSLSCRVTISGVDHAQLQIIRQIADYCDAHRAKWGIVAYDPLDEYLGKIRSG